MVVCSSESTLIAVNDTVQETFWTYPTQFLAAENQTNQLSTKNMSIIPYLAVVHRNSGRKSASELQITFPPEKSIPGFAEHKLFKIPVSLESILNDK